MIKRVFRIASFKLFTVMFLIVTLLFVIAVNIITFGWVPTIESRNVSLIIRLGAEKKGYISPLYISNDVVPLTANYSECRAWLFENAWADCSAVFVSNKILSGGINEISGYLDNACALISGAGSGYFGYEGYVKIRSFYSCDAVRSRSVDVVVYHDKKGVNGLSRFDSFKFLR